MRDRTRQGEAYPVVCKEQSLIIISHGTIALGHSCARSDILIQICVCRAHRPGSSCLRERFFFIAKWCWHSI